MQEGKENKVIKENKEAQDNKDKKTRILEIAQNYFTNYGFKATTMDQVAKAAGVAKGTIYNFFQDKEELYLAIIKINLLNIRSMAIAASIKETTLIEKFRKMILAVDSHRQIDPFFRQIVQEAKDLANPLVMQGLKEIEDEVVGLIQELFEESIKNNRMKAVDTRLCAFILFKAYVAYIYEWPYKQNINEFFAVMELMLNEGLLIN